MDRRSFIQTGLGALGWAIASAAGPQAASARAIEATGRYMFPHGVASGDPTASSVVLWTRVQANDGATPDRVALTAEVALDAGFETVLVRTDIEAVADADHTVRLIVTDLPSDTRLFYRFIAHGDVSMPLGHTRTAPGPDTLRPVRFATASCQNYEQGQYGAGGVWWKWMKPLLKISASMRSFIWATSYMKRLDTGPFVVPDRCRAGAVARARTFVMP